MRNKGLIYCAAALLVLALGTPAADAGRMCWQMEPYYEFIRVGTLTTGGGHMLINGQWYVPGNYLIPVSGTMERDLDGVGRRVAMTGTLFLGDTQYGVFFDAALDATTKSGTWAFVRNDDFINSGTLTRVACDTLPSPTDYPTLNAAGAGRVPASQTP